MRTVSSTDRRITFGSAFDHQGASSSRFFARYKSSQYSTAEPRIIILQECHYLPRSNVALCQCVDRLLFFDHVAWPAAAWILKVLTMIVRGIFHLQQPSISYFGPFQLERTINLRQSRIIFSGFGHQRILLVMPGSCAHKNNLLLPLRPRNANSKSVVKSKVFGIFDERISGRKSVTSSASKVNSGPILFCMLDTCQDRDFKVKD